MRDGFQDFCPGLFVCGWVAARVGNKNHRGVVGNRVFRIAERSRVRRWMLCVSKAMFGDSGAVSSGLYILTKVRVKSTDVGGAS